MYLSIYLVLYTPLEKTPLRAFNPLAEKLALNVPEVLCASSRSIERAKRLVRKDSGLKMMVTIVKPKQRC